MAFYQRPVAHGTFASKAADSSSGDSVFRIHEDPAIPPNNDMTNMPEVCAAGTERTDFQNTAAAERKAAPLSSSKLENWSGQALAPSQASTGVTAEEFDQLLVKLAQEQLFADVNSRWDKLGELSPTDYGLKIQSSFLDPSDGSRHSPAFEKGSLGFQSQTDLIRFSTEQAEVLKLKQELESAKSKIAQMDKALQQSRSGPKPTEAPRTLAESHGTGFVPWDMFGDSALPSISRPMAGGSSIADNWRQPAGLGTRASHKHGLESSIWNPELSTLLPLDRINIRPTPSPASMPGTILPGVIGEGRQTSEAPLSLRTSSLQIEAPPSYARSSSWSTQPSSMFPESLVMPKPTFGSSSFTQAYQPRPIGTPLSPTAAEFNLPQGAKSAWNAETSSTESSTYLQHTEPINYRRLLEKSVNCNWRYIVDKIVCNNDQQASIFLQQKLKVGTSEQKAEILDAIIAQAYPLMVNRFGNFLIQRCFEHGTQEQIVGIAASIRGNTLNLSMDAFGCHVIQKAFDCVPEEFKAIMVHELLRRIPETVVHRHACHVWQKLFELRWSDSPPQIMKYVNKALRGMWHEVALGETGSLVVQNIFENCLEEDKRQSINEVLTNIDLIAHGQFGNWCIQHVCEHGLPADRSKAIDHVVCNSSEYSMDQYASKVVEKCLKIGGNEFLDRYLGRVCEGRPDRPRIPLIEIASDQYGNYLIQWILQNADPTRRETVQGHIRKHMVSLRGSKFGSRVGMLCVNSHPNSRPGPNAGPTMGRYQGSSTRFGGPFR